MADFLIRMEGVNLSSVLDDTTQLSVIRGSSLLLRKAVVKVGGEFKLDVISVGASIGLYQYSEFGDTTISKLLEGIVDWLSTSKNRNGFEYFTFVVDAVEASDDFNRDVKTLISKNRKRQMQQMTFSLPQTGFLVIDNQAACAWNGTTPACKKITDPKIYLSPSVFHRFTEGKNERQKFFKNEIGDAAKGLTFTDDLQTLAKNRDYGSLDGKIAVIYFDGNSFGTIKNNCCKNPKSYTAFDDAVQNKLKKFLSTLLNTAIDDQGFKSGKQIRLEVLLWGGDEILIVVPAWRGFQTLQLFYEAMQGAQFNNEPLTFAGGIVFSQANTPIYRLRNLAKELADGVKERVIKENAFDYLILESIDYPSEPIAVLRERIYQDKVKGYKVLYPFDQNKIEQVQNYIDEGYLSKTSVTSLAFTAIQKPGKFEEKKKRLISLLKYKTIINELENLFIGSARQDLRSMILRVVHGSINIWPWIHLAQLWDYLFITEPGEKA